MFYFFTIHHSDGRYVIDHHVDEDSAIEYILLALSEFYSVEKMGQLGAMSGKELFSFYISFGLRQVDGKLGWGCVSIVEGNIFTADPGLGYAGINAGLLDVDDAVDADIEPDSDYDDGFYSLEEDVRVPPDGCTRQGADSPLFMIEDEYVM